MVAERVRVEIGQHLASFLRTNIQVFGVSDTLTMTFQGFGFRGSANIILLVRELREGLMSFSSVDRSDCVV